MSAAHLHLQQHHHHHTMRNQAEGRIITLLSETDMTFKQIIEQLKSENISASFNSIRRVNRNHQYRQPRYDPKLTAEQRAELIVTLKNADKPNLSTLAKQYGVCHGSIWYWWDKLNKAKQSKRGPRRNNGKSNGPRRISAEIERAYSTGRCVPEDADGVESFNVDEDEDIGDIIQGEGEDDDMEDELALSLALGDDEYDDDDQYGQSGQYRALGRTTEQFLVSDPGTATTTSTAGFVALANCHRKLVGRVQALSQRGQVINLPILMFANIHQSANNGASAISD